MLTLGQLVIAVVLLAGSPGPSATVLTIEGRMHTGTLIALGEAGATLTAAGAPITIPLAELQEVRLAAKAADPLTRKGQAIVRTVRGGWVPVSGVTLTEGRLTAGTELMGKITLGIREVAGLVLPDKKADPQTVLADTMKLLAPAGSVAPPPAVDDRLVVRTESGDLMVVRGVLKAITAEKITFNYDDVDRTIDTAKVPLISVAATGEAPPPAKGVLLAADGTRLAFDAIAMSPGGTINLRGTCLGELTLPVKSVTEIRFRSDNVVHLSDLTPVEVSETGTFEKVFVHRRDRSSLNRPIRLGGQTFTRGLGMHSRCALTYDLAGEYRRLLAVAGIDDAARPAGDATLTVLGDGKALVKSLTLTGRSKPARLRLDVRGVKRLTVLVDFGRGLDVGDHVDLADAKLIK